MRNLRLVFVIIICCFCSLGHAQVDSVKVRKNAIKINILSSLFNTTMLQYERVIKPNFSIAIGAGRKYSGSVPSLFAQDKFNLTLDKSKLTGFFFNVDARWYVNKCEGERVMEGFYLGPYFKYNRYRFQFDMLYDDGVLMEENSGISSLREYGVGFYMGYQVRVWKNVVIDLLFFGPRTSRYNIKFDFDDELSDELVDSLTENLNDTLDRLFMKGDVDPEINFKELKSSFSWLSFRYGISVGYAF